jgi:hypothetical protein
MPRRNGGHRSSLGVDGRGFGVATALDVQERAPAGDGAAATGPSRLASVGE